MKIFISIDAEGIAGISTWHKTNPDDPDFSYYRELATKEVNTVCESIREINKNAKIVVCDSHSLGENLLLNELSEGVELISGFPRNFYMMEGIDKTYDGAILLGYHSRIGSIRGGMDHSYSSSSIYSIKLNGVTMGESEINAGLAGFYSVPVIMVSGDDVLVKQVNKTMPGTRTVLTKYGLTRFSSRHLPLKKVYEDLKNKTEDSMKNIKKIKPFKVKQPLKIEIEFNTTIQADVVSILPIIKRIDGRKITFTSKTYPDFYRIFMAIILLASTARNMG